MPKLIRCEEPDCLRVEKQNSYYGNRFHTLGIEGNPDFKYYFCSYDCLIAYISRTTGVYYMAQGKDPDYIEDKQ